MSESQIRYSRADVIEALRFLNELVVSLDRIGSATAEKPEHERYLILEQFIRSHDIVHKAARTRLLLSHPFSKEIGQDGKEELEREMEEVPYWTNNEDTN